MLSYLIIVGDRTNYLRGCLKSLPQGEVVVVVTASDKADLVREIREDAVIVYKKWNNDFSDMRNYGLEFCSKEWVLAIDDDERLIQHHLIDFLNLTHESVGGYYLNIYGYHTTLKDSYLSNIQLCRLFKNKKGYLFENQIHERIDKSIFSKGNLLEGLPPSIGKLAHLGYDISKEEMKIKAERNLNLLRNQLKSNPRDSITYYKLGNTFDVLGDTKSALEMYVTAISYGGISEELHNSLTIKLLNGGYKINAKTNRQPSFSQTIRSGRDI